MSPLEALARTGLDVEERFVRSFDGTRIAFHSIGRGPAILLANGLGGSYKAWAHQLGRFAPRHRFLSWDYRGLYRSGPPPDRNAILIADHVRDALAVLDAAGEPDAVVFGWSMGVQVGLELYAQAPSRVRGLVLLNGVAGSPYEYVLNAPRLGRTFPHVLGVMRKFPSLAQKVTERVVMWPGAVGLVKRVGVAAPTLDESVFRDLAESFAGLDMELYFHILQRIGDHDARPVLRRLNVPALVVAGDRDLMTPRAAAEAMVREAPDAELFIVPGGTHYAAVEYPDLINDRIERFLRERGLDA
ncbi:MAG: alpha/beta fold hydrolase [Sandaracinaceae bacterium]